MASLYMQVPVRQTRESTDHPREGGGMKTHTGKRPDSERRVGGFRSTRERARKVSRSRSNLRTNSAAATGEARRSTDSPGFLSIPLIGLQKRDYGFCSNSGHDANSLGTGRLAAGLGPLAA